MPKLMLMMFLGLVLMVTVAHANVVPVGLGITVDCTLFGTPTPEDCGTPTLTNPLTFTVPEGGPGEPFIEYGLVLDFNVPFTSGLGLTDMLDPTDANNKPCDPNNYTAGCISDQISAVSPVGKFLTGKLCTNPDGCGEILFRSDPPPLLFGAGFVKGANNRFGCLEGEFSGCTFTLGMGPVNVTFFSDGDFVIPSPSSDIVMIRPVPEPSAMIPLGIGFVVLVLVRCRRVPYPAYRLSLQNLEGTRCDTVPLHGLSSNSNSH